MPARDIVSPALSCVCFHVRRADRILSQIYDGHFRKAGLLSTQFMILTHINSIPDLSMTELSQVTGMTQSTSTRNVTRLVGKKYVTCTVDTNDPRRKILALTDLGRAKLNEAMPLWRRAQAEAVSRLGEENVEHLFKLLNTVSVA